MSSTISLNKSLRTTKVSPGASSVGYSFRVLDEPGPTCSKTYMVDQYGRPASMDAGLQFLGPVSAGCFSTMYPIMRENILRPQYSEYLNMGGLQGYQSEYANRPHMDLLGVQRDKSFGVDGTYQGLQYPMQATNPNSDADWTKQMDYMTARLQQADDSRLWLYSADTQSGF